MKHIKIVCFTIILTAAISCGKENYLHYEGLAQGGVYRVTAKAQQSELETLKTGTEKILSEIDMSISGYNKGSALSRFNDNITDGTDDAMLIDIFRLSKKIYDETDGYFDISSGALFDAWGFGFKSGQMPDSAKIAGILGQTGMDKLSIQDGRLVKSIPEVTINFNAIAQGYSCDLIADYLRSEGITDFLIDVGGEILCQGVNPKGSDWKIGIDAPVDGNMDRGEDLQCVIEINSADAPKGVVTSGNYRKYYIKDGKKYAHTINPKSGYPVTHNLLSATVIADDASKADAYATYLMVIGLDESIKFVEEKGIEALLIYDSEGETKIWKSEGIRIRQED